MTRDDLKDPVQRAAFYDRLKEFINSTEGFAMHSGVRVTKVDMDYCEGELTITPEKCNYLGIVHGGCLATLADTVSGIAVCSRGKAPVTLNYGFSFLRQATGTVIKCVAEPESVGGTISVMRCALTDDQGRLVASGQFTFYTKGDLTEMLM